MSGLLLRGVELDGRIVDVRCAGRLVAEIGSSLARNGERVIDAGGGALIPGLHDHHLHLLAMAAAATSVDLGPDAVGSPVHLDAVIVSAHGAAPDGQWLRAVGYHESTGAALDRHRLDRLAPGRPVRVQHRSGHAWILSSAACDAVGEPLRLDGWFVDSDAWLDDRLPATGPVDLRLVGSRLARFGITGVTDATPFRTPDGLLSLADGVSSGALPFTVTVTGGIQLLGSNFPSELRQGPVKFMVDDRSAGDLDDLTAGIAAAHRARRTVALHCVTRAATALALAAWDSAGVIDGDRIEHGSVLDADLAKLVAQHGLTVVTQPGFILDRGDHYLDHVEPADLDSLYRCRGLDDAGVRVAGSTDAPFGPSDPWAAMRTAVDRRTRAGRRVAPNEAVTPQRALDLFLGRSDAPGGRPRQVRPGEPADLCLLDCGIRRALDELDPSHVAAVISRGAAGEW